MRGGTVLVGLGFAVLAAGCGDDLPAREQSPSPSNPPPDPTTGALCASGQICTLAGTGVPGDGQDGLPARETRLYLPQDTTVGPDGRLYVVDWNNHRIRVIEADGRMRIVAGAGELGIAADNPSTGRLNHPTNVTFDPLGSPDEMWIAAWHNSRVKKVDLTSESIIDMCGTGKRGFAGNGGPAAMAVLDLPVAIVFDGAGNLLIADQANQMIRRVDRTTDVITTIAGVGRCADSVNPNPCVLNDGGPATEAGFHFPIGQMAAPGGKSRSRPTAPSTSPTPTTSGCAASTRTASSPPTPGRGRGLRRGRRACRRRAARPADRRRSHRRRPPLHRRQGQ